jgi:hypothetical protein
MEYITAKAIILSDTARVIVPEIDKINPIIEHVIHPMALCL